MLPRKVKVWLVKRKLRLKREKHILSVAELINLEHEIHKQYLKFDRSGEQSKDDALYWKGKRDGIREIWKPKVKYLHN